MSVLELERCEPFSSRMGTHQRHRGFSRGTPVSRYFHVLIAVTLMVILREGSESVLTI